MKFLKEEEGAPEVDEEGSDILSLVEEDEEEVTLELYMKAGHPLIHIRTEEDFRAISLVKSTLTGLANTVKDFRYGEWKASTGLLMAPDNTMDLDEAAVTQDLYSSMKTFDSVDVPTIICFHNVKAFMANPQIIQQIKDSAYGARATWSKIILIGVAFDIPPELNGMVTIYDLKLPDYRYFRRHFEGLSAKYADRLTEKVTERSLSTIATSAVGMTLLQGEDAISLTIVKDRALNFETMAREKEQAIKQSDTVEFIRSADSMDDVGGFYEMKEWAAKRKNSFTKEAKEYGLKFPKGVLLCGIPGTGKSLCARGLATYFGIPLLKFDIGKVFKSLVGSSESSVRQVLKMAEAVAPVVLWIEEIDKSMSGSQSSGSSDSGTTARVMSTILTWMADNKRPILIAATANNVESLPPELLRKGRFSEVWGVVEPNSIERKEIWRIHISKVRPKTVDAFDYEELSAASKGYTGAEIEASLEEAMFDAWDDGGREVTTDDMVSAVGRSVPQAVSCKERIDGTRAWMKSRTRSVSGKSFDESSPSTDNAWRQIRGE